jgi:arylsulfatase A-like enzyme
MKSVLLPCLVLTAVPALAAPTERPNILWLVSEDNNPWLGCYGEPLARTPVIDRLAARGVRYANAHSPAPVCAPTRSSIITGRWAPSVGTQHMRSLVPLPADLRYFPAYLRDAGYYSTNRAKTDYNAAILPDTWDENGNQAHWRKRTPGQPFFAVFNFGSTHESNLHERRPLRTDPARVRVPAHLPDTPEVRADIAQYHDCLATMDSQVGAVLADLAADGLEEDTIVFYYGDNGGVLPRSKRFLYASGTHVPLIIAVPRKWAHLAPGAPGGVSEEPVSLVDLPATVLSLAGVPVPAAFQGRALAGPQRGAAPSYTYAFRDRMDEAYDLGRAVIGPRYRYIRNYRPELPAGQHLDYLWRMSSMREWERLYRAGDLSPARSAFFEPRAPEELFDVVADPDCVRNLAGDPSHREILLEMRAANRRHLLDTRDLGFMPEPEIRVLAGEQSPMAVAQDATTYPLAGILTLLDTLQLPAEPPAEALAAALVDPLPVIRYWAAVCAIRAPGAPGLEARLEDANASVRLAAADSLLQHRDSDKAWAVVAAALRADRPAEERLTAASLLVRMKNLPADVRQTLASEPDPTSTLIANYYRRLADRVLGREATPGDSGYR